ncbi:MAG TPA: thioredoxin family protein [Tepidisphaeraceae bacterium]|jgi:peroxiredoxin|nr:thioredoxin family protein [Tepidisphaeraceae bacterium]
MSFTLALKASAPDFDLPGTDGKRYSLGSFKDARLLLVVFWCNHCPYVIGTEEKLTNLALQCAPEGLRVVAINSNSAENHPEDSMEGMIARAHAKNYSFPYLRDEKQEAARVFGAMRTPHFFLFDQERKLRYTGRMDDNPKFPEKVTTQELKNAIDALVAGEEPSLGVTNPIGCNVKWSGKPEKWMPPEACDLV